MAAALALAVTLPAVSGAASLAAAGNVIPNPSFEEVCGQPTTACSWPDFVVSFGSAQRSTEIARTGEASLRIGSTTTAISTAGACFTSGVVPGRSYRFSYWYAARDPVLELRAYAQFWEQPNCTGGNTALYFNYPLLLDGQWHERSWTATAPAYARAARVVFEVHCSRPGTTCPEGGVAAYFDDFALEDQVPTSVSLNRLSALRTRHGVRLRWTTASERDVLGFNLYRRESGTSRKLNRSLIRSPFGGTVAERAYSFLDRAGAPAGTMYQLQAVELDGRRRWLASVSLPEVPVAASPALNELYPTRLYRVPSAAMEPTLHCARPGTGCLSRVPDMLVARRLRAAEPRRGDIVVFEAPALAPQRCGAGGKFIKRVIALPGETWEEREGFVYVNGRRLTEPYVKAANRDSRTIPRQRIPPGHYFLMGDNRIQSCDSREWGAARRQDVVGVGVAVVREGVILSLR